MDEQDEILHAIALSQVPHIGPVHSKILIEHFQKFSRIFQTSVQQLESIPGIGKVRAGQISTFKNFDAAEKELRFLQQHGIRALHYWHPDYPARLRHCEDPPSIMYMRGNANLNAEKIIAVVGTRKPTEEGRKVVDTYLRAWKNTSILVISGLAYGIDYYAHRYALDNGLSTVAVLANGLHTIYPSLHTRMAREMTEHGGLLTEFPSGTAPDRQNFPQRNRIVAGMSDALLVVETDSKGGSMITASLSFGYHREVFAIPGNIHESRSRGCNLLIRENRARLSLSPDDILSYLNWEVPVQPDPGNTLFPELGMPEKAIIGVLQSHGVLHIDRLQGLAGLNRSAFHASLLFLELEGICQKVAGNQYRLCTAVGRQ